MHVVSLWLVPATPEELAGIEQTDDGKSEAHSPAMRPFAEFQAGTLYADAVAAGLHDLNHRKLAKASVRFARRLSPLLFRRHLFHPAYRSSTHSISCPCRPAHCRPISVPRRPAYCRHANSTSSSRRPAFNRIAGNTRRPRPRCR